MDSTTKLILFGAVVAGGLYMLRDKYLNQPRGIRNNNPGNIRRGDNWKGMAAVQDDPDFVTFETPEDGFRAMTRILMSYRRRGVDTIEEIISTWAPPTENNTQAYINSVSQKMGADPQRLITSMDYPKLLDAIAYHENGMQPWSEEIINLGISMA